MTDAMQGLRERYRATGARTVASLRRLAAQLASPTAPREAIDALRRELHRVHGTAGTYGFTEASRLAAAFEERAIRWAADPVLDRGRRAAMTEQFAAELEIQLGGPVLPTTSAVSGFAAGEGDMPHAAVEVPAVVIVEDDPALVEMLRYALSTAGLSVRHHASGPEAMDALLGLDTGGTRPVILLDIDLPGLDGLSLHERLAAERPNAFTTVFLTARSGEAEQLRAYRAGAVDYVSKPVNLRILMAKLPAWLDRARRGG